MDDQKDGWGGKARLEGGERGGVSWAVGALRPSSTETQASPARPAWCCGKDEPSGPRVDTARPREAAWIPLPEGPSRAPQFTFSADLREPGTWLPPIYR